MRKKNGTNEVLRSEIADALLLLLEEKPLEEVSVSEITETAEVARVSYYRNFSSKEDVLLFKLNHLLDAWEKEADFDIKSEDELQRLITSWLEFFLTIRDFLLVLYRRELMHLLLGCFYSRMGPKAGDTADETYGKAFLTYGIFGMFNEWIGGGMRESAEQLSAIFLKDILGALKQ